MNNESQQPVVAMVTFITPFEIWAVPLERFSRIPHDDDEAFVRFIRRRTASKRRRIKAESRLRSKVTKCIMKIAAAEEAEAEESEWGGIE